MEEFHDIPSVYKDQTCGEENLQENPSYLSNSISGPSLRTFHSKYHNISDTVSLFIEPTKEIC
jgi:hypothetical protein